MDTSILYRFLVVEDSADDAEQTLHALRTTEIRFEYRIVSERGTFLRAVQEFEPDLVLSDYRLPLFSGLDAIRILRATRPDTPLVFVSGTLGDEVAAGLIREGAADYVLKQNLVRLPDIVARVLGEREQRRRVQNAEREAAAQQVRLTHLFHRSMDGILVLGPRGEIVDANPAAGRILGYSDGDLIGVPWTSIVENSGDEMASLIGESDDEAQARRLFSVCHHAGHVLDIDTTIAVDHDATGTVFVYVIFRDVTPQLAAERELLREKDLQQLLREVSYHPANLNVQGIEFRELLDRVRLFLGWDVAHVFERNGDDQELVSTNVWVGETADDRFVHASHDRRFPPGAGLVGRAAESMECVWVDSIADDANFRRQSEAVGSGLQSAIAFPVLASGRTAAVLELYSHAPRTSDRFVVNATRLIGHELGRLFERKWFDEYMTARRVQLESLIENAPDLIIRTDVQRRVQLVNSKIGIFGLSAERSIGKTLSELATEIGVSDETVELWHAVTDRAFSDGEAGMLEWSATVSGRTVHIQSSVVPEFLPGGEVGTALSFNRDISEQVAVKESLQEREAQIQRIQRLESIGRLAGGIAHDFNNILTAINGYLYLVGMVVRPGSKIGPHIEGIRFATDRAARLTQQLLLFSKRAPIELQDLDLNKVVTEVSRMLSRLIPENVKLQIESPSAKIWIRGDHGKIEQVIMNLVINARDAMPDGGTVTIRTRVGRRETVGADGTHREYAELAVVDTGLGMDDTVKSRLFEPFFSTKGHERGTGLGLPVVYGIVEEHHGCMQVVSAPGCGTTFLIAFPVATPAEHGVVERAEPALRMRNAGNKRVLVVEDDEAVRNIARKVLSSLGFHVTVVPSIADARRHLDGTLRFDVILSDVVLPDGSGTELLDVVGPDTPIVFASGYLERVDDLEEVRTRGAAFLQKPYDLDALVSSIDHALRGGSDV